MKDRSDFSVSFYSNLPVFLDYMGVADENNFHDVPDDWLIVVADVKGSTSAIESGRYKDVNILGASGGYALASRQLKNQAFERR